MLEKLRRVREAHGFLRPALLQADAEAPASSTYAKHFASLDAAYQQVFQFALDQVRQDVETQLRDGVQDVESYDDFLVLNGRFTVLIQPSVPERRKRLGYIYVDDGKRLKAIMKRVRELMSQRYT